MSIDQWEWEGMGILIVFPHTSITSVFVVCHENLAESSVDSLRVKLAMGHLFSES